MKRLIVTLAGLVLCSSSVLAQEPPREPRKTKYGWTELQRGQRHEDIEFDEEGAVWLHVAGERRVLLGTDMLLVSTLSRSGRYQILNSAIDSEYPIRLLDRVTGELTQLRIPRYAHYVVIWSPDERHVLISRDYEESAGLFVVSLPGLKIRGVEKQGLVPLPTASCCGIHDWVEDPWVGWLEEDSLRWTNNDEFEFAIVVYPCSLYDQNCDFVARETLRVVGNVRTGKVVTPAEPPR